MRADARFASTHRGRFEALAKRAERLPKVRSARATRVWHAVPSNHITNPVSRSHLMAHAHLAHPFAGLSHSSFSADILLGKDKGKRRKVRPQPLRVRPC